VGRAYGIGSGDRPLIDVRSLALPPPRTLALIALAVVGVAAVVGGGWFWLDTQARRAAEAYSEAFAQVRDARNPQAPPAAKLAAAQALEGVMARHPSAVGAPTAAFELGNLRYDAREWAAARGAYELAAVASAAPTIRMLARASIGYTWEAERNFAKAAEAYQAAGAGLKPRDFMFEELLLDLGRVQELSGKKPEAIETYKKLLVDLPGSPRAGDVRIRLASLGVTR
jgi:tetratricopeptide (TPR) repeat protein